MRSLRRLLFGAALILVAPAFAAQPPFSFGTTPGSEAGARAAARGGPGRELEPREALVGRRVPAVRCPTAPGPSMNARAPRSVRAAVCAVPACGLLACGRQDNAATGPPAASAPTARVLIVGTDAADAPFESQNEKGEIVGFDIDIVRAVAQKAGIEVKFVNTPWEGIFNA